MDKRGPLLTFQLLDGEVKVPYALIAQYSDSFIHHLAEEWGLEELSRESIPLTNFTLKDFMVVRQYLKGSLTESELSKELYEKVSGYGWIHKELEELRDLHTRRQYEESLRFNRFLNNQSDVYLTDSETYYRLLENAAFTERFAPIMMAAQKTDDDRDPIQVTGLIVDHELPLMLRGVAPHFPQVGEVVDLNHQVFTLINKHPLPEHDEPFHTAPAFVVDEFKSFGLEGWDDRMERVEFKPETRYRLFSGQPEAILSCVPEVMIMDIYDDINISEPLLKSSYEDVAKLLEPRECVSKVNSEALIYSLTEGRNLFWVKERVKFQLAQSGLVLGPDIGGEGRVKVQVAVVVYGFARRV